jgi:hypothetical protein
MPATVNLFGINPEDLNIDFDLEILMDVGATDEENVTVVIIEEDRIAYMHIASFFNSIALDMEIIHPFLYEVQHYEHLIIDIRGNGGGLANYFPIILMMLLEETIAFQYPEFYIESELTAGFYENPMSLMGAALAGVFDAAEFVEEQNMVLFNQDDLELFDKVLVWQSEFAPIPIEEGGIPFGGEIWMLVDGTSMSASEIAAKISVNTGFATVVGEPTAGVTGVIHTFVSLPNTGVLFRIDLGYTVDNYGRSIEEFGVIPQIINMPGLDALHTVLTLIDAPVDVELNTAIYLNDADTGISGVIADSRTLVPITALADIFESAELYIDNWATIVVYDDITVLLTVNSTEIYINDVVFEMPKPLQIINGEIFAPIRFVAEALGYDVDFIDDAVAISSNFY